MAKSESSEVAWDQRVPAGSSPFRVKSVLANRSTYFDSENQIRMPLYVANEFVADHWGVPRGTPFVRIYDVAPASFRALQDAVDAQLELERKGVLKDIEKYLPPRQSKIYVDDLEDTFKTIAHLVGYKVDGATTGSGLIEAVRSVVNRAHRYSPGRKP